MFQEMNMTELEEVNGGQNGAAVAAGTLLVSWAPVAAFIPGCGTAAAIAMALYGAGLIGKGSGAY